MEACWIMMTREKEELMSYEMRAKCRNFNTLKIAEALLLLDLITTLRMKSCNEDKGKIEFHMDNRETRRRIESTKKVANYFNQDSAAGIKATKRTTKEAYLDTMMKR